MIRKDFEKILKMSVPSVRSTVKLHYSLIHNSRLKFTCGGPHWLVTNEVNLVAICQFSKAGYVKITILSEVYLDCHQRDISEYPHCVPNFICWRFGLYKFSFPICCVFKNSSHFSSTDVTPFILRRCIVCVACGTVWRVFGVWVCSRWFCGGWVFVGVCLCVCVCVCVGIVWLLVEGNKHLLF